MGEVGEGGIPRPAFTRTGLIIFVIISWLLLDLNPIHKIVPL